ncbi:MAG: SAM-dependent methyltransferase [Defluviitaleaceae bacterium]|nr:SAM-dependent methyltransferase [Defluviitaleaceae bacterium]
MKLTIEKCAEIVGCKEHSYLGDEIFAVLFDKKRREGMFLAFLEVEPDVSTDWFVDIFGANIASLKSLKQHYTPNAAAKLLGELVNPKVEVLKDGYTAYDPTAGTGTLLIAKWQQDRIKHLPWDYNPSNYFYRAEDISKKNIPFLLFNFLIRGMNAIVIQVDTLTRIAEQVYFVVNEKNDSLSFSYLNVMPRTALTEKTFYIKGWEGTAIIHIESPNYFEDEEV